MRTFSLAAIIVMALSDDVLASIPHNDVLRLEAALREMAGNSEVDAALQRLAQVKPGRPSATVH